MGGPKHGEAFWENPAQLRLSVWGLIKMATAGSSEEMLFSSSGRGKVYELNPKPRSAIALQWSHFSAGTIPNELADIPCAEMNTEDLLDKLNEVFGTTYGLKKRGLSECLEHFLITSQDFGQVYGTIRSHWKENFSKLLPRLAAAREKDEGLRRDALCGGYIHDAHVPRRLMWDLYANRVLPSYLIPRPSHMLMPRDRMTISHSWVSPDQLTSVSTPINGHEWPVPMPRTTTLEHVRVELLNLGAEYVWLDVLCLRQRGRPEDEETRQEEWRLDVPTIGSIYGAMLCLTYFNGLGLPLDASPDTIASDRHWLNRVWTVQEATGYWLPGGLTGAADEETRAFFRLYQSRSVPREQANWPFVVQAIRGRACTTELDRVHGVAYSMFPHSLPVYEEGMSPPDAWAMLLKHIHPSARIELALRHMVNRPHDTALLPSWDDFLSESMGMPTWSTRWDWPWLHTLGEASLSTSEPGTFFQHEGNSLGPVYIVEQGKDDTGNCDVLKMQIADRHRVQHTIVCQVYGSFKPDKQYLIMKTSREVCLVAEVVGERDAGGKRAFEVVKRGCLFFADGPPKLPERYGVPVVYLPQ
ncbi:hypothetical protein PsYK624_137790 [Phanerochaete sordida]|uniref:Heterokaryon incompatibility domain-containing protein n=1 Tax=Phanerochaete sordida TaxID=48140 RepID=A0A9P3LJN8_9APHY|nr:hypothetical protein PsYK624_137790 [Phanerochaete sordida]